MLNKIKNIKILKSKYFYLVLSVLIVIVLGTTFAWWKWSSDINALVNGKVCAPEIAFVGGTTINGTDLLPVRTKEEGLSKDINVNLNNTCDNDTAVLNLNLNLEYFPEGLAASSFKWSLYQVTTEEVNNESVETLTYINDGNFANKVQSDVISLATDLIVTANVSTYRLFIWIDASMDNPSTIGGNSFRFKIFGTGTGAIYNPYTMKQLSNSSAAAAFWGSPINANQVKSIRFIPTDQIPSETDGEYNLSSVADSNDVTMYYVENGQTDGETPITLYDVYVASNNGMSKVKANTSAASMFAYLTNCEYIDAEGLDTSNATSMSSMFNGSSKLSTLKISNWDTKNVTTMSSMFYNTGTQELIINIANFDMSKVTSVTTMFYGTNASLIDLVNFNTVKLTSMVNMFQNCNATKINLVNFSNEVLTNTSSMFKGCKSTSINFDNFNTSNVTSMSSGYNGGMFLNCSNVKVLDLSCFNTSKVTRMDAMFYGCTNLEELNVSSFDTSKVTIMNVYRNISGGSYYGMFHGCTKLKKLDLSNFNLNKISVMYYMFYNCSSLEELIFGSNVNTSNVTNMFATFRGCSELTSLDLGSFDTSKVTRMDAMFYGCSKLVNLNLSSFNTKMLTSLNSTFYGCSSLVYLDLSSFETPKLSSVSYAFSNCSKLKELDLSNFTTNLITAMTGTFSGCTALTSLNLSGWNTEMVTTMDRTFFACSNLTQLDLSSFSTPKLNIVLQMFYGASKLRKIDMSNFDFSLITSSLSSSSNAFTSVPSSVEVIVNNCTQYNKFKSVFGNKSGLHTVNNETCTV